MKCVGIRKEDKNIWEKRVPLTPAFVKTLIDKYSYHVKVESFKDRAFKDEEYLNAGAIIDNDFSDCNVIFGVKEIPLNLINENKTYIFFSHTIKGQDYNMPLLKKMIEGNNTLIDYECIKDNTGRRLVFFGKFAGIAGMLDTLFLYGKRQEKFNKINLFKELKPAYEFADTEEALVLLKGINSKLNDYELEEPIIFGFAGYGNVSKGAQYIFDLLPHIEIMPSELLEIERIDLPKKIIKVVFKESDMFYHRNGNKFDLLEYFQQPHNYDSLFFKYLDKLDILINAIYWDSKYPRLITKDFLINNYKDLRIDTIGDISCDIEGSVEITYKSTPSDNPAYVYNPENNSFFDGIYGKGIMNIAVDNLPTELPKDSSVEFSNALAKFVPAIVDADYSKNFDDIELPSEIKNAIIVHNGCLAPNYKYLEKYIS